MADLILSLTTLCFSIYLFVESSKLPKGVSNIPGPGFFPYSVAWVVLILSFMLFSNSVWKIVKKKDQRIIQGRWKQILLVIIGTFAYVLLWGTGNFLINTWLLLFFIQLMTRSKWYHALIGSTILSLSIYLLFGKIFHVMLF